MQWLAAVELGLLKGHNPLMNDVNVSLHLPGGRDFNEGGDDKYLDYGRKEFSNDFHMDPSSEMLAKNVVTTSTSSEPMILSQRNLGHEGTFPQKINSTKLEEENSLDAVSVKENKESAIETDEGQGLQTTQLVFNMLEVSMPGTFTPEQKEKVVSRDQVLCAELKIFCDHVIRARIENYESCIYVKYAIFDTLLK